MVLINKNKKTEHLPKPSGYEEKLKSWKKTNRKYLMKHEKNSIFSKEQDKIEEQYQKFLEKVDNEISQQEIEEKLLFEELSFSTNGEPYNGSFLNRLPNLKNQRNKVLFHRLGLIMTFLGIPLIFLIYYVSPLSKLQAISVSGNNIVSKQTVVDSTNLIIGGNICHQYWHKNDYLQDLKKAQPRVKSAEIKFDGVNRFKLIMSEYKEIAVESKNGQYYPVIENGIVLKEKVENPTKDLLILENFTDQKKIHELAQQYNQLSAELQQAISEIKYTPKNNNKNLVQLNMHDGNQVIVNISNLANQMQYYSSVAKEMVEKGVIDMEVGIYSYPYTLSSQEKQATRETQYGTSPSTTLT